jgi:hypothetical protein
VNIEQAVARLAIDLAAKAPAYAASARMLPQLVKANGFPLSLEGGKLTVKHRSGGLVAVNAEDEVIATSTVPRGRVQQGTGEQGLKRRTVSVTDEDWAIVTRAGAGNASEGFRMIVRDHQRRNRG